MKSSKSPRADLHQIITDEIIEMLEIGTAPWSPGRSTANTLPLRHNGEPYRGINILLLWKEAHRRAYVNPNWMTYNQATEYGGQVRKGEKSSSAVFAKGRTEIDETTGEVISRPGFLRKFAVFNAGQIDNLPENFYAAQPLKTYSNERIAHVEEFIAATGVEIDADTCPVHYTATNRIGMPPFEQYVTAENYYHDLFHELTHWTRDESRLNRNFGQKKFADNGYIKEEMVAEIGSNFLLAHLGLSTTPENSTAYIEQYLEDFVTAMRDDKKLIVSAASHASKALEYILTLVTKSSEVA